MFNRAHLSSWCSGAKSERSVNVNLHVFAYFIIYPRCQKNIWYLISYHIIQLYTFTFIFSYKTLSTNSQMDESCLFSPLLDVRQRCNSMRFHNFIISDEILVPYSTSANTHSSKEKKERCEMMFFWVHFHSKDPSVQNTESHQQSEYVQLNNRTKVNGMSCVLPMHL